MEVALKSQRADYPDGIPECGADALRFGLLAYTLQGRDINLDTDRVVGYRQFCNKLWNATKFALMHLSPDKYTPVGIADLRDELAASTQLATRDKWILSRLAAATAACTDNLGEYAFGHATTAAYDFWLYELCDYYLELLKPLMNGDAAAAAAAGGDVATAQRLARHTLYLCLDHGLKLLHPFMPFITEELWQRLPGRGLPGRASGELPDPASIMIAPWPTPLPGAANPAVEAQFALFQTAVRTGRALRCDADIPPSKDATFYMVADAGAAAMIADQSRDLMTLLRASTIKPVAKPTDVEEGCSVATVNESMSVHLLLKGLINPAQEAEKLAKKIANVVKEQERIARKMAAPAYRTKVGADIQAADEEALAAAKAQIEVLEQLRAQYAKW